MCRYFAFIGESVISQGCGKCPGGIPWLLTKQIDMCSLGLLVWELYCNQGHGASWDCLVLGVVSMLLQHALRDVVEWVYIY